MAFAPGDAGEADAGGDVELGALADVVEAVAVAAAHAADDVVGDAAQVDAIDRAAGVYVAEGTRCGGRSSVDRRAPSARDAESSGGRRVEERARSGPARGAVDRSGCGDPARARRLRGGAARC